MIPKKFIVLGVVKLAVLVVAAGVVFSIYGCNTVQGLGQDIEKAGEAIKNAGSK
jgi:predicted small secreted protein